MTPVQQFGLDPSLADYILRPGGYAVIFSPIGDLAIASTPLGFALPGGGQEAGESPADAAVRETREECGLHISLGDCIGAADELVFAAEEGRHYRKRCTFFLAEIIERSGDGETDHELIWLSQGEAATVLRHESQRWAVTEGRRLNDRLVSK